MIRALAIDLDDTLVDTSGLLVPLAAERSCQAMKEAGLACTLDECLSWRAELAPNHSHREIFQLIARRAGHADDQKLGDVGSQIFYNHPAIPEPLALLPDADATLTALAEKYLLFLVTSGAPDTQWKKIRAACLENRFQGIFVVDKFNGQHKGEAFAKILELWKLEPAALLSVGNRLREEIRHAKRVGAQTCYFEYGEHVGETPEVPEDHPDFRIFSWKELRTACRL